MSVGRLEHCQATNLGLRRQGEARKAGLRRGRYRTSFTPHAELAQRFQAPILFYRKLGDSLVWLNQINVSLNFQRFISVCPIISGRISPGSFADFVL